MRKQATAFLLTLCLSIFFSNSVGACNENQVNTYVLQILFGDSALSKQSDEKVKMLLDALYLCSSQSDGQGADKLEYLKRNKVGHIPGLSAVDINGNNLLECSHKRWEYKAPKISDQQEKRKKILRNTVNEVFDFGLLNSWFRRDEGKCNSFAALLYYSHILADYLSDNPDETSTNIDGKEISAYAGNAAVEIGGRPSFSSAEKETDGTFINYSQLDDQGRAQAVTARLGYDILESVGERQDMVNIKPSGWNQNKYEGLITTKPPYLFNRCHLLAHQLGGGEIEINLITGTRYLNEAMGDCENQVSEYLKANKENHVLYRATPVFEKDNLLASGIQLEAWSIEDEGEGICFNKYFYNVQPGVEINYMNGKNERADEVYGKEDVLPFAISNVGENNPDLIYEMNKHLEILFDDDQNSVTYKTMMSEIIQIAKNARAEQNNGNEGTYYIHLKQYKYQYLEVLKSFVPRLLEKEDFFQSAFK